jgi:hypothetical protein
MANPRTTPGADVAEVVQILLDAAGADTVFGDVYFRRARELLGSVLSVAQHRARERVEHELAETVRQSKTATMLQDWRRVTEIAERIDNLRRGTEQNSALADLAVQVYDRPSVRIDPFSPGAGALPGFDQDLGERRDALLGHLKTLIEIDPAQAAFYESRRVFFAALVLASRQAAVRTEAKSRSELEQLAAHAAERGDISQLNRCAREILLLQEKEAKATGAESTPAARPVATTYQCPVDLAAPFPDGVADRARALGLAMARTEPLPQAAPLFEYITARIWQPDLSAGEPEHEGALRAAAVVDEVGFPAEVSESVKVLVGQFVRNAFINSGGARYFEPFRGEAVLIEDFAEDAEPPATGELLAALHLSRRRGLARQEIDEALLQHGATAVGERLQLDPLEFRLVCIPHDLYSRFGRDRGWGQRQQWTHFDGYQVLRNGALRALVGGDARYGGLIDLVSIAVNDQRESVIARFAVIRRARQVARWR